MEEMDCLWELLKNFQTADDKNESFNIFFVKFEPLLKKYARKLRDDDAEYMLAEALYTALLSIPINLVQFQQDKYIIGYIQKCVYTEYLKISKFNRKVEGDLPLEAFQINQIGDETIFDKFWYDNLLEYIYSILTETEKAYFTLRFIQGYADIEIAKIYSVSRQAVNKRIGKIKDKLKREVSFLLK